jgi:uncharacterized membrane protein
MTLARTERWFSLCILGTVLVFFIVSFQYSFISNVNGIGAAFVPRIILFFLLCLSVYYVWTKFKKQTDEQQASSSSPTVVKKQMTLAIMLVLCVAVIPLLGMLVSLGLFLIFALRYFENIPWVKSIAFSVISIIVMYLLFVKWLKIILPYGIFL